MIFRLLLVTAAGALLAGCATTGMGSVGGGECKVMTRPPYVVQGRAAYDQNWIDNEIEGGVAACGWKRPAPRPAQIDAVPSRVKVATPVKRPGLLKRVRDRVKSIRSKPPQLPAAAPIVVPEPPAAPVAPPPKRSAIDELLDPKGVAR